MKRILSVILCSVLIFTLSACEKTEVKDVDSKKTEVKEVAKPVTKSVTKPVTNVVPTKETPVVKNEEVKSREVILYFSDDQAMYLVGEKRTIEKPTAKSIVGELLKGPIAQSTGAKLYATLPTDLEILDVQVKDNIAYVDFKSDVSSKISGSAGEKMALFSIINTLVSDKDLAVTKVQFLVEGKNVKSIGQFDVSEPFSEDKELFKK